jgi:hypothetical protein
LASFPDGLSNRTLIGEWIASCGFSPRTLDGRRQTMIRQLFDVLFALTLVVPAGAVILGAISLALPRRRNRAGHTVGVTVHV